jgi:hypothetical protein
LAGLPVCRFAGLARNNYKIFEHHFTGKSASGGAQPVNLIFL